MKLVVLLTILLVIAGCYSRAAPVVIIEDPTPIHMTGHELFLGYDSSSRVIPTENSIWEEIVWVWDGNLVSVGVTYILPVKTSEGKPTAELVEVTSKMDGGLLLGSNSVILEVVEDTTYQLPDTKFWKIKIDLQKLPTSEVVLYCHGQWDNSLGQPVTWRQYYRLER